MAIRIKESEGELIFYVVGEIDHHNTLSLRTFIDERIRNSKSDTVVLDLSETEFCDSSALGLVLGRARVAAEGDRRLVVQNPSARAEKILELCGARKFMEIRENGGQNR